MNETHPSVLRILWDEGVNLPEFVGPFDSDAEAIDWADRNVPNGKATLIPLSYPYARPRVTLT